MFSIILVHNKSIYLFIYMVVVGLKVSIESTVTHHNTVTLYYHVICYCPMVHFRPTTSITYWSVYPFFN